MSDPKIENLLELSLDVSEDTREKAKIYLPVMTRKKSCGR